MNARKLSDVSISDQIKAANAEEPDTVTGTDTAASIEVFDNIPLPTGRAERQTDYRWDINVGQSFFVPVKEGVDQDKLASRLSTAVVNRNKRYPDTKYVAKKFTHANGTLGVMVWRVK